MSTIRTNLIPFSPPGASGQGVRKVETAHAGRHSSDQSHSDQSQKVIVLARAKQRDRTKPNEEGQGPANHPRRRASDNNTNGFQRRASDRNNTPSMKIAPQFAAQILGQWQDSTEPHRNLDVKNRAANDSYRIQNGLVKKPALVDKCG